MSRTQTSVMSVPTEPPPAIERKPVESSKARGSRYSMWNLNATREQLVLLAPSPIVRAADETFKGLRELRDLVGQGHDLKSPDYQQVLNRYQLILKTLRNSMREDLGTPPLDDDLTL